MKEVRRSTNIGRDRNELVPQLGNKPEPEWNSQKTLGEARDRDGKWISLCINHRLKDKKQPSFGAKSATNLGEREDTLCGNRTPTPNGEEVTCFRRDGKEEGGGACD